jgi:UDP-N-acetylglucosamine--N-acetylmuramyl-(pentapeptide) pyrophosphoryl-undecaprenol N-acetylglucosamine transferase
MKIAFTGAGGGHFYPLIAVAEAVRTQVFMQKINTPDFYFFSDKPYDERALFDNSIKFIEIPSGKLHIYPSLETVTNVLKTAWGILVALKEMYRIYPDIVFAKGGYASFPVLVAARVLSIPVIVHESDSVAGRVTQWAGKFAERVALSQREAQSYFTNPHIALTGQPIRERVLPPENYARHFPEGRRPVLLIIGGSQGSLRLNESILGVLGELLQNYDIVHQTGPMHIESVKELSAQILANHPHKDRYYAEGFVEVSVFYPKVDLVITRAGSTTLFETALWHLPQIVVPIPETISRDQHSNAYAFFKHGTCSVIEENNLTPHLLLSEINRIITDKAVYLKLSEAGKGLDFSRGAANTIATEILRIAISHYQ